MSLHQRVFLLSLFALACAGARAAELFGVDLHGHPVPSLADPQTRVVVLVFAATDCPISNRYVPEVARLARTFAAAPVKIWWVFPNPGDTVALVLKHNASFAIHEPAVIDDRQRLVRLAHVAVTPEAAVFAVEGGGLRELYHGRIDDRYIALGEERPQPQRHELEEAIRAALAGSQVPQPAGRPVGCSIIPVGP